APPCIETAVPPSPGSGWTRPPCVRLPASSGRPRLPRRPSREDTACGEIGGRTSPSRRRFAPCCKRSAGCESDDGPRREAWARTTWWLVPFLHFYAAEDFPILIFRTRIKGLPRLLMPLNGIGAGQCGCRNLVRLTGCICKLTLA